MRRITQRRQFRNDLGRQRHRSRNIEELIAAVELLAEEGAPRPPIIPTSFPAKRKGVWECHIEPDWLLLYEIIETELLLIRTGSHSDLFD